MYIIIQMKFYIFGKVKYRKHYVRIAVSFHLMVEMMNKGEVSDESG